MDVRNWTRKEQEVCRPANRPGTRAEGVADQPLGENVNHKEKRQVVVLGVEKE